MIFVKKKFMLADFVISLIGIKRVDISLNDFVYYSMQNLPSSYIYRFFFFLSDSWISILFIKCCDKKITLHFQEDNAAKILNFSSFVQIYSWQCKKKIFEISFCKIKVNLIFSLLLFSQTGGDEDDFLQQPPLPQPPSDRGKNQ